MHRRGNVIVIVLVIALLVIAGIGAYYFWWRSTNSDQWQESQCPAIQGQVLVSFPKTDSVNTINSFLKDNNLSQVASLGDIPMDDEFIESVAYPNGATTTETIFKHNLSQLEADGVILSCANMSPINDVNIPNRIDSIVTHCVWNPNMPLDHMDTAITKLGDIEFSPSETLPPVVAVSVPGGQENAWIAKLEQFPEVQSAERSTGNCVSLD